MRVSVVATGVRSEKAQRQVSPEPVVNEAAAPAPVRTEQPALASLDVAAMQDISGPVLAPPLVLTDMEQDAVNMAQIPLSIGNADPVDPLGKSLAADAFIAPPAAQPAIKSPIVATRDAIIPQRRETASRQAPSLLVRMGFFGRKAARNELALQPGTGAKPNAAAMQEKAADRMEPSSKHAAAAGSASELDIPAFLRRTAN